MPSDQIDPHDQLVSGCKQNPLFALRLPLPPPLPLLSLFHPLLVLPVLFLFAFVFLLPLLILPLLVLALLLFPTSSSLPPSSSPLPIPCPLLLPPLSSLGHYPLPPLPGKFNYMYVDAKTLTCIYTFHICILRNW